MIHLAGTDFSHLTDDELIKGIKALDLPDYIRSKAYGIDVRETLAQMTEMTIQLGVNMGLSPDDALKWARKLQETVSQSEFDSWVATLLDGGPSIFMNTLSELQSTYPNGAAGVALVRETDPAKIYVWSGTAWEDFGNYQGVEVKDDSISFTKIKTNTVDLNILDNALLSAEKVELFEPSTVSSGFGISTSTGDLVASTQLKTTAYIPIAKGAIIDFKVFYDRNGFTYGSANAEKIAFYDSNLKFIKDYKFDVFENNGAPVSGYFRIAMDVNRESVSIKTNKSVKIDKKYIQNEDTLLRDYYMSEDLIELYNRSTNTKGKTFSGYTNKLVDFGAEVTNYIFIPRKSNVSIVINNKPLESATPLSTTKVAFYDSDLNHVATAPLKDVPVPNFTRNEDFYVRFALVNGDVLNSVKSDKIAKIDTKFLPVQNGSGSVQDDRGYDVFVFMGQSNMAGRGIQTTEHPEVAPDASDIAYEYRAITSPNTLTPLSEPFGVNENVIDGIDDGSAKTGSLVSSFAIKYNEVTGKKLIGISASKGGTSITQWQPNGTFLNDTINRINLFNDFANENNLKINKIYMVWCQGEGDGSMSEASYNAYLNNIIGDLKPVGVEKCLLVRIGQTDTLGKDVMIQNQTNIAKTNDDVVLVGNLFAKLSRSGYLKDSVHYVQAAYNIQGEQAGVNTAYYLQNQKEPTIYDTELNEVYQSHTGY